jgi:hypothetical protein
MCETPQTSNEEIHLILICGDDMRIDCTTSKPWYYWTAYGGQRPLDPVRAWASANGVGYSDYGLGPHGVNSDDVMNKIVQDMLGMLADNSDMKFILIGFSAGGPASTGVASKFIAAGGSPSSISHIIQLDNALGASYNTQESIDVLRNNHSISMTSIVSLSYAFNAVQNAYPDSWGRISRSDPPGYAVPLGSQLVGSSIFSDWSHTQLAVDQTYFDEYVRPILEGALK